MIKLDQSVADGFFSLALSLSPPPRRLFDNNDFYVRVTAADLRRRRKKCNNEHKQHLVIVLRSTRERKKKKEEAMVVIMSTTTTTAITTIMLVNNMTKDQSFPMNSTEQIEESFAVSWDDILYDGGLATWLPRSSFRWLTIFVCLIGIFGKFNIFSLTNMENDLSF